MLKQLLGSVALAALIALGLPSMALAQQGTRLPWTSTFDSGDFSEWDGFRNTTGVTFETAGCQAGRCIRAPLLAGTNNDNYGDFHFGDFRSVNGPKVEEVWLRFYSRIDPGILWPNRSQKLAILNLTDGQTSTKYYQVYVYVRPNGDYATDHSYFAAWQFFGLFQNVGTPIGPRLGQWDKIKLRVRLNTPGQANGVVQLWVNDALKVDHRNVNIREGTSYGVNKLNISSYSTQPAPSNGTQWWDSVTLSTTDPDGAAAPNPPSNVRVE